MGIVASVELKESTLVASDAGLIFTKGNLVMHQEVVSKSWWSRLMESIKGVVFGLLIFLLAFPLLYWNEGRSAKASKAIGEGRGSVVTIQPDAVDDQYQGKLVHITGLASSTEKLEDSEFDISRKTALRLKRTVEMYQWQEHQEKKKRKKMGGGEETTITYTYDKVWSEELIDSSRFKERGYENPSYMEFKSRMFSAHDVDLGVFNLKADLVKQIDSWEDLNLEAGGESDPFARKEMTLEKRPDRRKLHNGGYYFGDNPSEPEVGDLKVKFRVVMPTTVSIVAAQDENSFKPYKTSNDKKIYRLQVGEHSATDMFDILQKENTQLTWILRGVFFLMMVIGLNMIFRPLVVVADVVPLFGNLLSTGVGMFSLLVAAPLWLLTVAAGWIVHRPLIGGGLLVLGVAAIVVAKKAADKAKKSSSLAEQDFLPPGPPAAVLPVVEVLASQFELLS